MPSAKEMRKIKRARALGVAPGDISSSSSEDEATKGMRASPTQEDRAKAAMLSPPTETIADKFSSMPKHANRFALLLAKKASSKEANLREFEEKLQQSQARLQAKREKEAKATASAGGSGAGPTGEGSKFKAPKKIPLPCPAVPVQKNQVCPSTTLLRALTALWHVCGLL